MIAVGVVVVAEVVEEDLTIVEEEAADVAEELQGGKLVKVFMLDGTLSVRCSGARTGGIQESQGSKVTFD